MSFKHFFSETTNKFNTDWQDTRERAKKIKNVDDKIKLVKDFLQKNPSKANYARVLNWTRMTKLGYKNNSPDLGQKFEDYLDYLYSNESEYTAEDTDTDLEDLEPQRFVAIYRDLINRKNNFQHGGKRPQTMVEYLAKMKQVAAKRKISLPPDPSE
jgi:hypothetical protein